MRRGFILAMGVALGALWATGPSVRGAEPAASSARTFGAGLGLCVKFSQGQPMKDLDLLKDLGVRWVRDHSSWARMEPAPGRYELGAALRERLAFYRQNDIGVVFCLAYDNRVAHPPTPDDPHRNIDPQAF
ncbi:MAG: beta-galactosidase, partial [Planctomycetes bacterium]|nr:beta-galactosidase [Planctomycetota bacterium]